MGSEKALTLPWRERRRGGEREKPGERQKDERAEGRRIRRKDERSGAHSSTTLHYVRYFPEDSLGSGNREDVSVRGEGESAGDARRWPNKYLTKSSGKLIPSLGRLLRGIPSAAAPSTSERRARTSPCRSIPRFSSCDFATGSAQGAGNHAPTRNVERRALKILERYRNSGFP